MRIIVSAGGTGGHIYPALSIIDKIKEKDKDAEILYIGTTYRMEKDIVPKTGINYYGINVRGFDRKISLGNIRAIRLFIKSLKEIKKVMKEFKPDVVIGVGGFVTGPVIYVAHKLHIKTIIHEQNSMLGMTNKFLSRYADVVCTSFPDTEVKAKKVVYTGNPSSEVKELKFDKKEFNLSKDKKLVLIVMGSLGSKEPITIKTNFLSFDKLNSFLSKDKKLVLIVMGSLGSKVVNEKMKELLLKFNDKDYEVLFITGNDYYDLFNDLKLNKNVKIVPFIDNLKRLFTSTDVLVTRAGATTISEIIAFKVPSILVPSPYVTDNHQYKNAMSLVNKELALIVEEKDLETNLIDTIDNLLNDKDKINRIKNNLSMVEVKNSASKIYELVCEVVNL